MVILSSDSAVNTKVSKPDQKVDGDDSYAHIADFACDSAVDLMLGLALVFPTEHFSHLKVPVSEQEVAIVVEHLTQGNTEVIEESNISNPVSSWLTMALVILSIELRTEDKPVTQNNC